MTACERPFSRMSDQACTAETANIRQLDLVLVNTNLCFQSLPTQGDFTIELSAVNDQQARCFTAARVVQPLTCFQQNGGLATRRLTSGLTYIEHQCISLLRMDMSKDLVAASATPLVLAILAEGDSYGYAIIKRVAELSGGHLQWSDGMLYPVLHRLERQGYVAAKWSAAESGRRRKYYRITKEGRAQLAAQRQQWKAVDGTLRGIWMQACTV
jgi:PadR family transcriptional regulator PadR